MEHSLKFKLLGVNYKNTEKPSQYIHIVRSKNVKFDQKFRANIG